MADCLIVGYFYLIKIIRCGLIQTLILHLIALGSLMMLLSLIIVDMNDLMMGNTVIV